MQVGTEAAAQEREQVYTSLADWLATSSFSVEAPTHGVINEHQLIESGQITRDLLVKMMLGLERLRAILTTVIDKVGLLVTVALHHYHTFLGRVALYGA